MAMTLNRKKMTRFLVYLVGFFFLLKPDFFSYAGIFTSLYNLGFAVTFFASVIVVVRRKTITTFLLNVIVIAVFPLLIGIAMGTQLTISLLIPVMQVVGLAIIVYRGTQIHFEECVSALAFVLEIYTYLNLLTIVLYPNGLYDAEFYSGNYWFLGYKNVMTKFLLPAVTINSIATVMKNRRYTVRLICLWCSVVATMIMVDNKTGLIGIAFIIILLALFSRKKLPAFFNLKNGIIFLIVISIVVATTSIVKIFSPILLYLGEDKSVLHRQEVWIRAFELILKSPIWGYGLRSSTEYRQLINLSTGWGYISHPHNYILYTFLQGGSVLILLVINLIRKGGRKCLSNRKNYMAKAIILMYASFFVMGIAESLTEYTLLYPMILFTNGIEQHDIQYRGQ